uniref:Uncharacterized protein n=1 Tax=Anguilla anguilla TaxID=7936 RepID=A0A0E9TKG7_ANGAN
MLIKVKTFTYLYSKTLKDSRLASKSN